MALVFRLSSVVVSGAEIEVFDQLLRGLADARLIVANVGSAALTAARVQVRGEPGAAPADVDTTTFATLGPGQTKQLIVTGPIERLRMEAASVDARLDVWVTSEQGHV